MKRLILVPVTFVPGCTLMNNLLRVQGSLSISNQAQLSPTPGAKVSGKCQEFSVAEQGMKELHESFQEQCTELVQFLVMSGSVCPCPVQFKRLVTEPTKCLDILLDQHRHNWRSLHDDKMHQASLPSIPTLTTPALAFFLFIFVAKASSLNAENCMYSWMLSQCTKNTLSHSQAAFHSIVTETDQSMRQLVNASITDLQISDARLSSHSAS